MSETFVDAIESGNVDRVAELLAAGVDVNATVICREYTFEFRLTPLLVAIRSLQTPGEPEPGCTIETIPTFRRIKYSINSGRIPDDPAYQERLREIRELLGDPSMT